MQIDSSRVQPFSRPARSVRSPTYLPWPDRPAPHIVIHTQSAGRQGVTEQLALFPRRPARGPALRRRVHLAGDASAISSTTSRRFRCSHFSSANMKASGGWRRSAFATITRCGVCRRPIRSRLARSAHRSSRSVRRPRHPDRARFSVPNTTPASASAGTAISRISTGYSAYRWVRPAGSVCDGSAGEKWQRYTLDAAPRSIYMMSGAVRGESGNTAFPLSRLRDIRSPFARWLIESCARAPA